MIRSRRIPQVLDRICDEHTIVSAVLVTLDGELLGTSTPSEGEPTTGLCRLAPDPEAFGTLVADICMEYIRLGEACQGQLLAANGSSRSRAALSGMATTSRDPGTTTSSRPSPNSSTSTSTTIPLHKSTPQLQCLLIELEQGTIAASQCGTECLVLALAAPGAAPGLVKTKLEAVSAYLQEALSTLGEG